MRNLIISMAYLGFEILFSSSVTAKQSEQIPTQIDSRSQFVVWADVDRLNFDELLQWATKTEISPLILFQDLPEQKTPAEFLERLRAAGAKRVYLAGELTALMGDLSAMGMIIRCDQPEQCAAALAANPLLPTQFLKSIEGAVLLAFSPEGLQSLAEIEGEPSANLAAALELRGDMIGISAAIPPAVTSLFLQSAPNDGTPQSKALRSLVNLKWARLSGSPPDSKLSAEARFNNPEQATEFAQSINSLAGSAIQSTEKLELLIAERERVMLSNQSSKPILEMTRAARASAQKAQDMNTLRQLTLMMHSFHEAKGALPPQALTDQTGKRLLSWRVLILPYVFEQELYQQFQLDEAWDSPHNLALLEKMPNLYRSAGDRNDSEVKPGHTRFVAPLTSNSIFGKPGLPTRLEKILDGTSNTILLVQAAPSAAVPWTKPDDLVVDTENPLTGLASVGQNYLLAAFADGSVRALSSSIDSASLKALFSQDGREVVESEKFEGKR